MSGDDYELQLALDLSRATFEEEAARRGTDLGEDLIRFENPDEPARRQTIKNITRLYGQQHSFDGHLPTSNSQPSNIGWKVNGLESNLPFISPHQIQGDHDFRNTVPFAGYAPTVPARIPSTPEGVPQSRSVPALTLSSFPPAPAIGLLNDFAPPLPPKPKKSLDPPPIFPRRSQGPSVPVRRCEDDPPPIYPRNTTNFIPSHYECVNGDLYIPYMCSSIRGPSNGDLIDLGDGIDVTASPEAAVAAEQIRREFDPLYRLYDMAPATSIHNSNIPADRNVLHDDLPCTYADSKRLSPSAQYTDSHAVEILSLSCIHLESNIPPLIQQFRLMKERGRRKVTSSSLRFLAPTADYMTTAALSVKVVIITDHSWQRHQEKTISLSVDTSAIVNFIVTQALTEILPDSVLSNGVPVSEYGLKVFGFEEFLPETSALGQNVYVGKCILRGEDVKLAIGRYDAVNRRGNEPSPGPIERTKSVYKSTAILDKEDIDNLLVHLGQEMETYEEAFNSGNTIHLEKCRSKVQQCVKMLCKLMNSIEPDQLHKHLQNYIASTTAVQLWCNRNDFVQSLHSLISVFCRCTMSEYTLKPLQPVHTEEREITHCRERLKVVVNSVHNLPEKWIREYSEFYVTLSIYHGTRRLEAQDNYVKRSIKNALFQYLPMDVYFGFQTELCMCPRETKMMVILCGISRQHDGNEEIETRRSLGFASIPLFDHNMALRQGQLFVPLSVVKDSVLRPWGPHPLIANEKDAIIHLSLPTFHYQVLFPDVIIEFQSVRQELSALDIQTQEYIMDLIESGETQELPIEAQEMLWQKRAYLMNYPEALPLVLSSVVDWGYAFLANVYQILDDWAPLSPVLAMQLLLPQYPDVRVRTKAIEWIMQASSDFLFSSLPQLVECLRFEMFEDSSLAVALLNSSYQDRRFAFEIYWQLQQRIDHCVDFAFTQRCSLLQKELLDRHASDNLRDEIAMQHRLLNDLDALQMDLRAEQEQNRNLLLNTRLGIMDSELLSRNVRLPIFPALRVSGVDVAACHIFNSNAKPLKIVFRGVDVSAHIIHKSGDDMRQDALVLQLVALMNDVWLSEGLDLKIILFRCMPVGYKKGMGELVQNCSTLCDIQGFGVFKDDVLKNWLERHNSSEFNYQMALDNFTRSCAGWCVATYILGIGDRHNDNILVTYAGHVFHIDFGKYLGDWQMAGGFKRDRVPFVFTAEMYHVINGGAQQSENYQTFIDYCCRAFNSIRKKYTVLTNVLKIMACSDIPGVNVESLNFVERNLMLELTETDATIQFTTLINDSLNSMFTRLNFFVHTFAQKWSNKSVKENINKLSFVSDASTPETDGKIRDVRIFGLVKKTNPKVYYYKMEVSREHVAVNSIVYRSFDEINELYRKLLRRFTTVMFPPLGRGTLMRSNNRPVAEKRLVDVEIFFKFLFTLQPEVSHCDLVYMFFHTILRDSSMENPTSADDMVGESQRGQCQVYLKIELNRAKKTMSVFVGHVRQLALMPNGQAPDAYVKAYIRPDPQNLTKKKTQVVKASQNPTFNQDMVYEMREDPELLLSTRVLEVSVWNSGGLMDRHKMYMVYIPLQKLKNQKELRKQIRVLEGWYALDKNI